MSAPVIIGLHGLPQVGKDTIAAHLIAAHNFRRVAFADAVKTDLVQMFDVPGLLFNFPPMKAIPQDRLVLHYCIHTGFVNYCMSKMDNPSDDERMKPRSPRWLMQTYATDFVREHLGRPHYWIDLAFERLNLYLRTGRSVVVTDVRNPDEARALDQHPVANWTVNVYREGVTTDQHSSNTPLPEYCIDSVISNNGTITDLHKQVDAFVSELSINN